MKCTSCGKVFDYEKYYGICPKCGTYNKNVTPQEQHDMLHDAEDGGYRHPQENQEQGTYQDPNYQQPNYQQPNYQGPAYDTYMNTPLTPQEMNKIKSRKTAAIVLLILTLVFFIGAICIVMAATSYVDNMELDTDEVTQSTDTVDGPIEPKDVALGETFTVDDEVGISMSISQPEVVCEANVESDFPENERLVAVLVSGTGGEVSDDYDWDAADPVGDLYVGYGSVFETSISEYDLDDYADYTAGREAFSPYSLTYDDSTGYVYFFLPQDVTDFYIYVEHRDTATNVVKEIYRVPFSLGAVTANTNEEGQ